MFLIEGKEKSILYTGDIRGKFTLAQSMHEPPPHLSSGSLLIVD